MEVRWQEADQAAYAPARPARLLMPEIASIVAERHRLTLEQLRGVGRTRTVVLPRQEAFYQIYIRGWHSTTQIGAYFGGRDHTTVIHGIRQHRKRLAEAAAKAAAK